MTTPTNDLPLARSSVRIPRRRASAAATVAMTVACGLAGLAPLGCAQPERQDGPVLEDDGFPASVRRYVAPRATTPIAIDGRLDDAAWENAPWSTEFVDILGDDAPTPRYRTRMKMMWDDSFLYVGASMVEPHVWATLTERDSIVYYDNDFEIFIDPDSDGELYFEVEVNAFGTIFDLFLVDRYVDGGPALHEWDYANMRHRVWIDGTLNDPSDVDRGWSVEFALPWEPLRPGGMRIPPQIGDAWRINFSRVQWRHDRSSGQYRKLDQPEDNWVWSPQGVVNMHMPSTWGVVRFEETVPPAPLDDAGDAEDAGADLDSILDP